MTRKLIETVETLKRMEFNVKETMNVLTNNKPIYWSWGTSKIVNMGNKGLLLKVNGNHHKGYVLVTLDRTDTYNVNIISTHGNILNTYEMVYFDMLVETIDNRIEKIPDYKF